MKNEMPWVEFLERYLIYGEEFMFIYNGTEYHFAFSGDEKQPIAELNVGTKEDGYIYQEYSSAAQLIRMVRIDGKSIKEIWDQLQ